jgi:hypothetical protein
MESVSVESAWLLGKVMLEEKKECSAGKGSYWRSRPRFRISRLLVKWECGGFKKIGGEVGLKVMKVTILRGLLIYKS